MPRILIIDDEKSIRNTLRDILEYEKFEVDEAPDGLSALEVIKKQTFDAILCDIKMPKMDGIDVFKTLRELEAEAGFDHDDKAKIIMTTAVNDREIITDASEAGCETYVWKPIEMENFIAVMQNLGLIE